MPTDGLVYADASALVKLLVEEPESAALDAELADTTSLASSELVLAEVARAVRRRGVELQPAHAAALADAADGLLAAVDLVPLDRPMLLAAGELVGAHLRTLDAIHVVAALSLGDAVAAFVTYDERQAASARSHGLVVRAPGGP